MYYTCYKYKNITLILINLICIRFLIRKKKLFRMITSYLKKWESFYIILLNNLKFTTESSLKTKFLLSHEKISKIIIIRYFFILYMLKLVKKREIEFKGFPGDFSFENCDNALL